MPTRKDKTNVAPIYREQVFIPASGATLIKQKARPKVNGIPINDKPIEIVSPEFDLLTGIRGIANLPKGFLKTNKLPQGENLYYRQLDKSSKGLERAKQVGVIDTKSAPPTAITLSSGKTIRIGKTFNTPFFAKGHLWYDKVDDMDVIVGKDNPLLDWKTITKGGGITKPTPLNTRRTPFYMGESNQAPTELFELYRRYPGIGYRNVTHGFPTIPITGLNTVAEQMKCGGRRKAQLGLDIREGGIAQPIAPNMYYMIGRSHDNGGIAIGPNNKNGLEVEGGEVVKVGDNDIKVFSSVPLLRGVSPAQLVMGGANPNKVFKAQEDFKDKNRINDDGTTYKIGGEKIYQMPTAQRIQYARTGKIANTGYPIIPISKGGTVLKAIARFRTNFKKGNMPMEALYKTAKDVGSWLEAKGKITKGDLDAIKIAYKTLVGKQGEHIGMTFNETEYKNPIKKAGGIYIKPSKRGTFTAAAKKRGMGVQEFASKVLANKEDYSPAMVKKANFARNASRWKKELGGSMIYTVNGNVKNGLMNVRPKAQYGKEEKINNKTKIGEDGLVYKRGFDGNWYTDGTIHPSRRKITNDKNIKQYSSKTSIPTTLEKVNFTSPLIQSERKKIGNLYYEQTENGQWKPAANQSSVTTRNSGRPSDFGMTRVGINHPNGKYTYHPLTGEKIDYTAVDTNKTAKSTQSSSSSTPRKGGTKGTNPAVSRGTAKVESPKPITPTNPNEARYASRVQKGTVQKPTTKQVTAYNESADKNPDKYRYTRATGFQAGKSTSSTGGETQSSEGRWIGQYKPITTADWIGLGSNLAGTIASYFMTKNAINKMPDPIKPVMAQAAKLKTRYNVEPQLTNIREAEQMNRAAVRRNTQSSNTSLAREQRLLNEARGARNVLYGQKENIETQLINQDRLNRQTVNAQNVATYNDYLTRLYAGRVSQNEAKISNINNLLSGLTGSVNNILGTIESRRATNNTLRAIAAANPNVDARLIGGFDYYIDPITKRKYNKNQQYIGTINS